MKCSYVFYLIAFCCVSFTGMAQKNTNHALIVAISNYKDNSWNSPSPLSSLRDVSLIDATLKKRGFADIKTLTDADATVQGISNAFEALIKRVHPGDVVVVHFSTHGEQVQDDNGDESDGLDECIVTYNAMYPSASPHDMFAALSPEQYNTFQADYYRDDLLDSYIEQLRAKLGSNGDVAVFMDLCHSGTATRGIARVRGNKPPLVSTNFDPKKYTSGSNNNYKDNTKTRGNDNNLATYIVYSACEADDVDREAKNDNGEYIGSLSYAVSKALSNLDNPISYRAFFADIQTIMSEKVPQQHPVVEGNGLDRTIFGGRFVKQQPYVEIAKINDGTNLSLNAGKMQGLDSGAIVAVYQNGTTDTLKDKAKKLATGVVVSSTAYASEVKLYKNAGIHQAAEGWVFIEQPVYNTPPLSISFKDATQKTRGAIAAFSQQEENVIRQSLAALPLVKFDAPPELIITKGSGIDSIIVASNGYLFNTAKDTTEIKEKIQQYIQYKYLKNLNIKDEAAQVEIKLIPFINGKPDTTRRDDSLAQAPAFKSGDQFVIWAKNTGSGDIYLNILDMQPDGMINRLLPNKSKKIYPDDLKIQAGAEKLFNSFPIKISPPYGTEIFKVFASTQQMDVEDIATTKGAGTRGSFSGLEKLVQKSYTAGTRGADADNLSNADGSCFNFLFEIKP